MQEDGIKTGTGPAIFQFIGLAGDKQFPKAGIFTNGIMSKILAIGLVFAVRVLFKGRKPTWILDPNQTNKKF